MAPEHDNTGPRTPRNGRTPEEDDRFWRCLAAWFQDDSIPRGARTVAWRKLERERPNAAARVRDILDEGETEP